MGSVRVNTFEIDFSVCGIKSRPPIAVVHLWIKDNLKIPVEDVDGIQCDNENSKVYLKLVSKEIFEKWKKLVNQYNFTDNKGTTWKIPVREVTQCTLVRVVGVTLETSMEPILDVLKDYGEIQSSEFEKYGQGYAFPVRNGVRLFKIILNKPIPSYIRYEDKDEIFCTAQVFYTGQTKTCKICGSSEHFVRNCPRRRGNPGRQVRNYYKASETEFPPFPPPESGDGNAGDGGSSRSNDGQGHTNADESPTSQNIIPSSQRTQKPREKRQREASGEKSFSAILQQTRRAPKLDVQSKSEEGNKMVNIAHLSDPSLNPQLGQKDGEGDSDSAGERPPSGSFSCAYT